MIHGDCTRRRFLAGVAATALPASPQSSRRPNILFLLADDQRSDALGCMGNRIIRTPVLDRLAAEGVTFYNNFCATAICMTSRASIFTGQHEKVHGVSGFQQSLSPNVFANTYPALLRKAGYRTGFIGKFGLGGDLPAAAFDYFKGFSGQGKYVQVVDGKTVHLTDVMGDQALEFIEGSSAEQPFCLSVSFKAPHVQDEGKDPLTRFRYAPRFEDLYRDSVIPVPKTAAARYVDAMPAFVQNSEGHKRWQMEMSTPEDYQKTVKGYYRLIAGIDEVVGRMLDTLARRRLLDNTIVIYTADNGFFLGERALSGKWLMHEESIRTPLIIRDPRLPAMRGKRRGDMTLNIDLAPTILRAAGIDAPRSMQGRDLTPLTEGRSPSWRHEFYYSHLFAHPAIPKSEGIRDERWKYIRYIESEPLYEELYDLRQDPLEEQNLARAGRHDAQLKAMRERWKVWRTAIESWKPGTEWRDPRL